MCGFELVVLSLILVVAMFHGIRRRSLMAAAPAVVCVPRPCPSPRRKSLTRLSFVFVAVSFTAGIVFGVVAHDSEDSLYGKPVGGDLNWLTTSIPGVSRYAGTLDCF